MALVINIQTLYYLASQWQNDGRAVGFMVRACTAGAAAAAVAAGDAPTHAVYVGFIYQSCPNHHDCLV
jgi:hypothetical protein